MGYFFEIVKLVLYLIFIFVVWFSYKFVYKPYLIFRAYSKQRNVVAMSKTFVPIFGDLLAYQLQKKFSNFPFAFARDLFKNNPGSKLILLMIGSQDKLVIADSKVAEELVQLIGTKIDREQGDIKRNLAFWMGKSFPMIKTTKGTKERSTVVFHQI